MTDEQIIKTLECCGNQMFSCTDKQCKAKVMGNALDLIKHQKAEIEKLKADNKKMFDKWEILDNATKKYYADLYIDGIEAERAEAIKEFAERLKSLAYTSQDWSHGEHPYVVEVEDIDNVAEEMTEGE